MSDNSLHNKGVVITGGVGFGKTAILEQLIEQSFFETGNCGLVNAAAGMLSMSARDMW